MMSYIVIVAKWLLPDLFQRAKETNKIQVITICFSHYCEFSSWALSKGGFQFEEHAYAPGQHILPSLALRVGGEKKYLSNSSRFDKVTTEADRKFVDAKKLAAIDKKAHSTAVPAAVFPDGSVLCDSWEISAASGLPPIDPALKKLLDEEIGPLVRQGAYIHILKPANRAIFNQLFSENKHWIWRFLWWIYFGNYLHAYMVKFMKPNNSVANKECRDKLIKAFDEVGHLIRNKKTPFLGGETIGLADIAIASLMAPLITPPLYCKGQFAHIFDKLEKQDSEVHKEAEFWRSTVAGEYSMYLYAHHRL